jgi:hypothetical protein
MPTQDLLPTDNDIGLLTQQSPFSLCHVPAQMAIVRRPLQRRIAKAVDLRWVLSVN